MTTSRMLFRTGFQLGHSDRPVFVGVQYLQIDDDPEAGSALTLLLAAAGYEVEADIIEGTVFISSATTDPDLCLDGEMPQILVRQLRQRLDDLTFADEVELAELSREFRNPAA